ncbi:5'/3'-nucleotidase SurE [Paractinoplanes ferrugineus]|uniref:5'-nucleotidase n=1 Tax=Paractinoplanes ferrugineus TaxID=113564 RepID=A0A919J7I4_9ACTN|nr:5'/3'-nucleotidase SurE [Actinoplanes ferrugineus]GIE15029.1 5'/3'-nucleotidase SurE [Actinoplanes ferrugineus]
MRILITNDDGIDAPGLIALAEAVRAHGFNPVVAAPAEEASGMSAALTAVTDRGRITFRKKPHGYGVAASPAYIVVLAALGVFGPPPQIVLSGINRGANTGTAVLHSGTVGAALTAANHGARGLAVSLDVLTPGNTGPLTLAEDAALPWPTAATLAAGLLDWLAGTPPGTVANLNVPDRPTAEIRHATLATAGQVRMAVAEQGEDFARLTFERGAAPAPGSDVVLLAQGYATLTALRPVAEATGVLIPAQRAAPPAVTPEPGRVTG